MLTLYPLQFGAPKGHGQVEGDEVFMVTHRHQKIKFHFSQHLWQTKHTCCNLPGVKPAHKYANLYKLTRPIYTVDTLLEDRGDRKDLLFKCVCWICLLDKGLYPLLVLDEIKCLCVRKIKFKIKIHKNTACTFILFLFYLP